MAKTPWHESDNPSTVTRGASWRAGVWIICVILFFGLIGIGTWLFRVGTSDLRGQGNATQKINAADNRMFAQGNFERLYQEVQASDKKLQQAAQDVADHPGDQFYAANYTGLKAHCTDTVAQYNAAARTITQAKFRDAGLPDQIGDADPATDCQENTTASARSSK